MCKLHKESISLKLFPHISCFNHLIQGAVQLNIELAETANLSSTVSFVINVSLDLDGSYTTRRNYHSRTENGTQLDLSFEVKCKLEMYFYQN